MVASFSTTSSIQFSDKFLVFQAKNIYTGGTVGVNFKGLLKILLFNYSAQFDGLSPFETKNY